MKNKNRTKRLFILKLGFTILIFSISSSKIFSQVNQKIPLEENGSIPVWLVAGPFEQPTFGFGNPADADKIDEKNVQPFEGKVEDEAMVERGKVSWIPLHTDKNNFVDFNNSIGWNLPGKNVEKIWEAKAGYAAAYIESPNKRQVKLLTGSNSSLKIILNGEEIFTKNQNRNAVKDNDTVNINLKKGKIFCSLKLEIPTAI